MKKKKKSIRKQKSLVAIGGYLKKINISTKDRQEWWDNLEDRKKQAVMDLPNFDPDIFYECTGIKVNKKGGI